VSEVLMVGEEEIEPPSPVVTTVDSAFITGIAKVKVGGGDSAKGRLIILLDLTKVLSTEEQGALQELQEGTAEEETATGGLHYTVQRAACEMSRSPLWLAIRNERSRTSYPRSAISIQGSAKRRAR
jgi:hypothetical protein